MEIKPDPIKLKINLPQPKIYIAHGPEAWSFFYKVFAIFLTIGLAIIVLLPEEITKKIFISILYFLLLIPMFLNGRFQQILVKTKKSLEETPRRVH